MHKDIVVVVMSVCMEYNGEEGICMLCNKYSVCCAEKCGDVTTGAQELCITP